MSLSPAKQKFVDLASAKYGEGAVLDMDKIREVVSENSISFPSWFSRPDYRVARGTFRLPKDGDIIKTTIKPLEVKAPVKVEETSTVMAYHNPTENMVPKKDPLYVPFGHFNDVYSIVKSGKFYPVFITGLSGNGKTFMIEQACA